MAATQVKPAAMVQPDATDAPRKEELANLRCVLRSADLALRLVAAALTLAAAVVMGVAREEKTVPLTLVPTLPPMPVAVLAKSTYSSASVYFIIANAVACAYTLFSLLLLLSAHKVGRRTSLALAIADLAMVGLLYSGNGAQAAIGVIGHYGNRHVGWNKICGVFTRFCNMGLVAFVASLTAAMVYLLIVSLSAMDKHRGSKALPDPIQK